jgi:hypothetical protein
VESLEERVIVHIHLIHQVKLETNEEEMYKRILHKRESQPVDQLDRVIYEIIILMLKSVDETINKKWKLIRGGPVEVVVQQKW